MKMVRDRRARSREREALCECVGVGVGMCVNVDNDLRVCVWHRRMFVCAGIDANKL